MPDQIIETTPETTKETPRRYQCRHIFIDGHRCGSPSLRREPFCYYHHTTRGFADEKRYRRSWTEFELPPLEDRSSVLAAVAEVLQRIAFGNLPSKQAGLLLYGLQIASLNLPKTGEAKPDDQDDQSVEEVIADPRFGDLAPVAEIGEPVEPSMTSGQFSDEPGPGAPSPDSEKGSSTPQSQHRSETPQTQPQIEAPRPLKRFVDFDIPKSIYKSPTPEPESTEAQPTTLPNLQAGADPSVRKTGYRKTQLSLRAKTQFRLATHKQFRLRARLQKHVLSEAEGCRKCFVATRLQTPALLRTRLQTRALLRTRLQPCHKCFAGKAASAAEVQLFPMRHFSALSESSLYAYRTDDSARGYRHILSVVAEIEGLSESPQKPDFSPWGMPSYG